MKYHKCDCGHTTFDHAAMGNGACLIDGCECRLMKAGEEISKPANVKVSETEAREAAAERARDYKEPK